MASSGTVVWASSMDGSRLVRADAITWIFGDHNAVRVGVLGEEEDEDETTALVTRAEGQSDLPKDFPRLLLRTVYEFQHTTGGAACVVRASFESSHGWRWVAELL